MNPHRSRLIDLAEKISEEVVEELAPPDTPVCEICGAKKYQVKKLPYDARTEIYSLDCTKDGCDGHLDFARYVISLDGRLPIHHTETTEFECSRPRCSVNDRIAADLVDGADPTSVDSYHIPLKGILTCNIHEHHTSYVPEETVQLCAQCHRDVHTKEDYRPDLTPEMSRKEWEETKNA